jgi:hypothetical protein
LCCRKRSSGKECLDERSDVVRDMCSRIVSTTCACAIVILLVERPDPHEPMDAKKVRRALAIIG